MSSSNQLDTTTIVLLILGTIILLPLFTMRFGGMMGYLATGVAPLAQFGRTENVPPEARN